MIKKILLFVSIKRGAEILSKVSRKGVKLNNGNRGVRHFCAFVWKCGNCFVLCHFILSDELFASIVSTLSATACFEVNYVDENDKIANFLRNLHRKIRKRYMLKFTLHK